MPSLATITTTTRTAGLFDRSKLENKLTLGLNAVVAQGYKESAAMAPYDTGLLQSTVHGEGPEMQGLRGTVWWGSDLYYSRYQELGTPKMAAQPYLVPVLRRITPGSIRMLYELVVMP